jgi:hypothetical protein
VNILRKNMRNYGPVLKDFCSPVFGKFSKGVGADHMNTNVLGMWKNA